MGQEIEVARDRRRALELTPAERASRRRNRGWLLILFGPPLVIVASALIVSRIAQSSEPGPPRYTPPAGYRVVDDGYFSYAVPAGWSTNAAYTDAAGDADTSGTSGWAAEHIAFRSGPPTAPERPPAVLDSFGMPRPEAIHLGPPRSISVPGSGAAYEYLATRPGGWSATVVDAWDSSQELEIWLVVRSTPAITSTIVASLRG